MEQARKEEHILKSMQNAMKSFGERYTEFENGSIELFTDKSEREEFDSEVFANIHLDRYPVREFNGIVHDLTNIVSAYGKLNHRNHKKDDNHLNKHAMHLIRLYLMCLDILENEDIITYREKDHDFLMEIRNGKYLDENRQPIPEFFDIVDELEAKLNAAKQTTDLPDNPDYKKINEFVASVNERIVRGEI